MPSDTPSDRQRIILAVGLPGSGKSTHLEKIGANALSSDWVRLILSDDTTNQTIHPRVFATIRYLLRHRLAIGRPVTYIDATSLTPDERRPYIQIARWYRCDIEALFFDVPVEICRERNRGRNRIVPDEALDAMAAKLVPPTTEEGFSRITVVRA
jgi:predicted kinase